ncbi:WhiB family transcriptional regulator [Kitasatospora sp. NPDC127116]|uniref:WhiB family transcriptional regulator n=1 Tax=Kitasatospora sp. NPDC127116 TaxID=3345367 RepID=UPI00363877A9
MIATEIDTAFPCKAAPELFHVPEGREPANHAMARISAAKSLCFVCPVISACRNLGRQLREIGVWGGEDDDEREAAGFTPGPTVYVVHYPECGTEAGAKRHRRAGEAPCRPCQTAESFANVARKRESPRRGTRPGYQRHRRRGETACDPCRHANSAADRRLATTGSTKAAA